MSERERANPFFISINFWKLYIRVIAPHFVVPRVHVNELASPFDLSIEAEAIRVRASKHSRHPLRDHRVCVTAPNSSSILNVAENDLTCEWPFASTRSRVTGEADLVEQDELVPGFKVFKGIDI